MFEELFNQTRLITYFFITLRSGAILFSSPIFGSNSIRPQLRMGLALILGVLLFPVVPEVTIGDSIPFLLLMILIAKEIIIGVAIGTVITLLFSAAVTGGYLLDFQMGFSMVNLIDPESGGQFSYMSNVINIIVMLFFIAIDGPGMILQSLAYSYSIMPPGNFDMDTNAFLYAVTLFAKIFTTAIVLLSPALLTLMGANAVMGVLGKLIPQINLMVVGFPIKIFLGMVLFISSMKLFYVVFEKLALAYFKYAKEFMNLIVF